MNSEMVANIVQKHLEGYQYQRPEKGSTIGEPWPEQKILSYIPKLKNALVKPYLAEFLLKETAEQLKNEQYESYWVIAKDGDYIQWYDPKNNEYGLAQESNLNAQLISIGVRGDLVGVYCAM